MSTIPSGQVAGTYYSEPLIWGFSPDNEYPPHPDPGADAKSQGYISCVAKRDVAFLQPDDGSLDLIALVMIGMAEVSSIEFDQMPNNHFKKGDMIGRFHFGGSSHCLVFGPGVKFTPVPEAEIKDSTHMKLNRTVIKVCSKLGTLTPVSKRG
ncbi:hypothetical protein MMC21_005952 [Puttea exsequens]|nr:hypothetical protein [Puttea exsequens]